MRIPHLWLLGAILWLLLSLIISLEVLHTLGSEHLFVFSGLLSLLWLQFGLGSFFHSLLKGRSRELIALALITIFPPLLLFLLISRFV